MRVVVRTTDFGVHIARIAYRWREVGCWRPAHEGPTSEGEPVTDRTDNDQHAATSSTVAPAVVLRDVTLRDGLQDEAPIPTETKAALFEALVRAGVKELELTSFVRPDRVPALADAEQLATICHADGVRRWGLVLNRRGADRALAAGLTDLQFVFSVSETHNLENAGRHVRESLVELRSIADAVAGTGATLEVTLSTAFGCPYEGPVAPEAVLECIDAVLDAGVDGLGLADTIGTGVPREVSALVAAAVERAAGVPVGAHLHDTRGLAIANAFAAVDAGACRLDASLGGLGGCPFAPGASGNVALEDLAHALEQSAIPTGLDVDALVAAAQFACASVGRRVESHVGLAGPRFAARARAD